MAKPGHDGPIFFVHIAKTGGTTLDSILEKIYPHDAIYSDPPNDYANAAELNQHFRFEIAKNSRLVVGHYDWAICDELSKQVKVYPITFLREPIDRVVSVFEYWKKSDNCWGHEIHQKIKNENLSFKDFLELQLVDYAATNFQTRQLAGYAWHNDFNSIPGEQLLEIAKKNLRERVVAFGLMERYDDSLWLFYQTFGWKPPEKYDIKNVTPHRAKVRDIPQDTLDLIAEMNQLDLQLYDYAKALFDERLAQARWPIAAMKAQFAVKQSIKAANRAGIQFSRRAYYKVRYTAHQLLKRS